MRAGVRTLALAAALIGCSDPPPAARSLNLPVADAARPKADAASPKDPLSAYLAKRRALDRTLWANEELAQHHETWFIGLWDRLRGGADPAEALGEQVDAVVLPDLGAAETLAPGITRRRGAGGRRLDGAQWRALLAQWKGAGYTLAQSEWHHRRFDPGEGGAANRSKVKAELHVTRGAERLLIRTTLDVEWRPGDPPTPKVVAPQDLEIRRHGGPAPFASQRVVSAGANTPQAILAYDLGHDGVVELIVPSQNRVHPLSGDAPARALVEHPVPNIRAAVLADFTGDGVEDLMAATRGAPPGRVVLYEGTADGRFPTAAKPVFISADLEHVRVLAPGDVDGDGDLDLWVTQYRGAYNAGRMPTPFHDANDGLPSFYLRNDGGAFIEATGEVGLAPLRKRHTQSASFFDFDGDGDADLLTVNDFSGVDLHRNDRGHFTVVTDAWVDRRNLFGMAHTLADLDGDGALDLFATGMNSTTVRRLNDLGLNRPDVPDDVRWRTEMTFGNRFYRGVGGGRFRLSPVAKQVAASGWSWGTVSADWDRDGDRDLFIANGFLSGKTAQDYCTQYWRHDVYLDNALGDEANNALMHTLIGQVESGISWNGFEHDRLFLNTEKGFVDVGFLLGLGHEADGRNAIATDFDRDGRVDLLLAQATGNGLGVNLLRYVGEAPGHWIGVTLKGAPGVSPLGARVVVATRAGERVAAVVAGDSFMAQHPAEAHFGLGAVDAVERVDVRWPDGSISTLKAPAIDRYHAVSARSSRRPAPPPSAP